MERCFSAGIANSTNGVYSAGISRYQATCNQFSIPTTPASEDTLRKFVTYLALNHVSVNIIKVYLAGVRQLHIQEGLPPPPTSEMAKLAQVLRSIRISQATSNQPASAKQRLPIAPEILQQVKAIWQQAPPSQDRIMLWAAFLTCFFGFF